MKMELNEAKEKLENSGFLVEAKMSLKDKLNNARQFNKNQGLHKDLNKDEILLIKIAKENGYELIGKDKDDDGSNRFIFEKKYRGETISFNASLYYENNDCQINYDFDYESGNDYFDETWGENLKTYEDEAIREIDEEIEEREWEDEDEDIDEALKTLKKAGLITEKVQRLDEWGQTLAKIGLCLAMMIGVRACNGKMTSAALEKIDTKQGNALQLFNEYNQEEFGGVLSQETSMARAVFGAVIQYAQKNHCSIADAAKRIKKEFVGELRAAISPDGTAARITSVISTHDEDSGDIVLVSFRYKVGTDEHSSYKSSEVIIPANAAGNYNKHVPVEHYKEAPAEAPVNMHYSQY